MAKRKRNLSKAQRAEKARLQGEYMTVFINGKQKRVKRELDPTIDGIPVDEFIRNNADPIWLHENEMWELMEPEPGVGNYGPEAARDVDEDTDEIDDLPF